MLHDPVCGMTINPAAAAHRLGYQNTTYYFCSAHCLERFQAAPSDYLTQSTEAGPTGTEPTAYICPMHPDHIQEEPGTCPVCGMALEPVVPPPVASHTTWTCPMHPDIVRDALGICPICGMALERRVSV